LSFINGFNIYKGNYTQLGGNELAIGTELTPEEYIATSAAYDDIQAFVSAGAPNKYSFFRFNFTVPPDAVSVNWINFTTFTCPAMTITSQFTDTFFWNKSNSSWTNITASQYPAGNTCILREINITRNLTTSSDFNSYWGTDTGKNNTIHFIQFINKTGEDFRLDFAQIDISYNK
jgi:hypothetical protein